MRQKKKITVTGLVQGVGFRPAVAELAEACGLCGQVKNMGGVVEILISGEQEAVEKFLHRLKSFSGNVGRIDRLEVQDAASDEVANEISDNFVIVESSTGSEDVRFLPVDFATCDRCKAELFDKKNRRYRYPFISCTQCGPRYSIQKAVPYDRGSITMGDFQMCPACEKEYTQKGNIRRHAQTIACHDCGPKLRLIMRKPLMEHAEWAECGENEIRVGKMSENFQEISGDTEWIFTLAVAALQNDQIVAIKDIGGFHFAFSPMSSIAAKRLREFKHRDKKPFAVMFPDIKAIKEFCEVSPKEEEILCGTARPIVLLKKKKDFVPEICGESDRIGALLPCNPLQMLLLEETGPLVMTSGNRGGEPIIIADAEMEALMKDGCPDMILTHDREILTPLDDSIYQVNRRFVQLIRRARGLVPEPIEMNHPMKKDMFAAGGDLKAVFALGRGRKVYLSQYFGDLEDVRCMKQRRKAVERMESLLEITPEITVGDMHPAYVSAQDITEKVQHHMAHVASVIAEHRLEGNILGIACDGTGFGTDGTIWGSEFFMYQVGKMKRVGHFSSVKLLGGDASAKEADKTLFSYMMQARERGFDVDAVMESDEIESIGNLELQEMAWKANINTAWSSSMGRLFDAVSALLDVCHYNSYEGECAILLEQAAHIGAKYLKEQSVGLAKEQFQKQFQKQSKEMVKEWSSEEQSKEQSLKYQENLLTVDIIKKDGMWIADSVKLIADLAALKEAYSHKENGKEILAYLFHHAVAKAIVSMAEGIISDYNRGQAVVKDSQNGCNQIALSGGSFINRILLLEVAEALEKNGHDVYTNEVVPCGDGGIALGQIFLMQ